MKRNGFVQFAVMFMKVMKLLISAHSVKLLRANSKKWKKQLVL